MNARKILCCALAVLALGLAAADVAAALRVRRLQAAAVALGRRWAALSRQADADARTLAAVSRASADAERTSVVPNPAARGAQPAGPAEVDPLEIIAVLPELRGRYLQSDRAALDLRWGLLFRELGLAPDKLERLRTLLARRTADRLAVDELAAERGQDPNSPEGGALSSLRNRATSAAIAALLGPGDYARYRQYNANSAVVSLVADLAGNLDSAQLTTEQGARLVQVLGAASQRSSAGRPIKGTVDIPRAMSQAGAFLSAEQLPVLEAVLQKDQAARQIQMLSPPQDP